MNQILVCGSNNFYAPGEDCAVRNLRCIDGNCTGCQPGARRCVGTTSVETCNSDGLTWSTSETCTSEQACDSGRCVSAGPCGVGGKKSNQGCDYWAVDLPNADVAVGGATSPASAQYAVVVSNTDDTRVATVNITKSDGAGPITVLTDRVPPRDVKVFNLPARNADQCGANFQCANVGYKAYRIQSTIPVVAYQFNPLNNTNEAFSNDASLLLPTNALDTEYIAVTGDAQGGSNRAGTGYAPWGAFVSVVGVSDSATNVTVTAPAGVVLSTPITGATQNGQVVTATLAKYQVLTVLSRPAAAEDRNNGTPVAGGGNLSGTRVVASQKVAVFAGNTASVAPHGPTQKCCADHMEEQLFPLSSWGSEYIAARSYPRKLSNPVELELWRITAAQAGTTLTYVTNASSALDGQQPTTLAAGQSKEFAARGDFIVSANKPILVAQIMTSSQQAYDGADQTCTYNASDRTIGDTQCTNAMRVLASCLEGDPLFMIGQCAPLGDPSLTLIPPIRQFRRDYVFLTPLDYAHDYVVIMAPVGTTVTLDGSQVTAPNFQAIGTLNGVAYTRARIILSTRGRHVLTASAPVGLLVGGYDRDVSYSYPGGLNLESSTADGGM